MIGPLITAAELAALVDGNDVTIADCRWYLDEPLRGRAEYEKGHVPGAVYWSLDDELTAPNGPGRHPLPDREAWAHLAAEKGVTTHQPAVVYDDAGGAIAARLWWMLRAAGHLEVAVLDGGIQAWVANGNPLTTDAPAIQRGDFTAHGSAWPGTIDRAELADRLGEVALIDARTPERFRGDEEPIDPIAGHIPTAHNIPHTGNLDADGRMITIDALRDRYRSIGTHGDVVVYCGSGVTGCHDILAMEAAGVRPGTLYPGSWSDWCTSGGTVALGSDPGVP